MGDRMSDIKVYPTKRLWTCWMEDDTTTITAWAVVVLEGDTLHILPTLWVQKGVVQVGIQLIKHVAEEHVATDVRLDILRDQSIVVMTRDPRRLFADLEGTVRFHSYDDSRASDLEEEVRRHLQHTIRSLMTMWSLGGSLFSALDSVMAALHPWRFIRDGASWFTERSEDLFYDDSDAQASVDQLLVTLLNVMDVRATWDDDRSVT